MQSKIVGFFVATRLRQNAARHGEGIGLARPVAECAKSVRRRLKRLQSSLAVSRVEQSHALPKGMECGIVSGSRACHEPGSPSSHAMAQARNGVARRLRANVRPGCDDMATVVGDDGHSTRRSPSIPRHARFRRVCRAGGRCGTGVRRERRSSGSNHHASD